MLEAHDLAARRGTLLLFLMMGAIYAGGYFLISRQERVSSGARFWMYTSISG